MKSREHYIKAKIIIFFAVATFLSLNYSVVHCETFQEKLEKNGFDIVETFDNLQDWVGAKRGGYSMDPADLPKTLDGGQSNWTSYSCFNPTDPPEGWSWIGNHGEGFSYSSQKSLCVRYNVPHGTGPDRMAMIVYPKEQENVTPAYRGYKVIHVFFMVRFHPGFFQGTPAQDEPKYLYCPVMKFLDITPGFRDSNNWGTVEEQQTACDQEQIRNIYGIQGTLFNIQVDSSLKNQYVKELHSIGMYRGEPENCYYYSNPTENVMYDALVATLNKGGVGVSAEDEWVGMEFILDTGDKDTANGSTEIRVYNQRGIMTASQKFENQLNLSFFQHKYNKIEFGGNRFDNQYQACSNENRFYIDDVIVDESDIADKYFSLLPPGVAENLGTE